MSESIDKREMRRALQKRESGRQVGKYYSRPNIVFGNVWCKACQKACDFDITCAHNAANPARSQVYIQALCHGQKCDVFLTFMQWHDNENKRIEVFDDFSLPEPERPATPLPQKMPLLLMDRQPMQETSAND